MTEVPIILLAAGQSSRMGGSDKLLEQIDGTPLLRRSAEIARAVGPVIVALPAQPHARYDAVNDLDVTLVPIPDAAEGMNASLRGALAHVDPQAAAAMVLLADLPELTSDDLAAVLDARIQNPGFLIWRGATRSGKPGHPVIFDRSLFDALSRLTGDIGAQSVVRAHKAHVHKTALPGTHALQDLDTPEDWAEWRKNRVPK